MGRHAIVARIVAVAAFVALAGCVDVDEGPEGAPPTFTEIPGPGLEGVQTCSVAWGDCDNDGDLDLAVAGATSGGRLTTIYENDGAGSFSEFAGLGLAGVSNCSLAWGDVDSDGDLDLAVAGYTGADVLTTVYENDGAGGFTEFAGPGLTGVFHCSVAWGDCDNDGDLDLAIAGYKFIGRITTVYENDGAGVFTELEGLGLPSVSDCSLAWGDADNDGDLDLAVAGEEGGGYLAKVYENIGGAVPFDGTQLATGLVGVSHCSLAWGDADNDGDLDLALAGEDEGGVEIIRVYENAGGAVPFDGTELASGLTGVADCSLSWGDCEGDGDLDLAVAGYTGSAYVAKIYENDGSGALSEFQGLGLAGVGFGSLAWGDCDNDGDLDLAVAGWTGGPYVTKVYENDGPVPNTPPDAPTWLEHMGSVLGCEVLRCNASADAETPTQGLSYNLMIKDASGATHYFPAMAEEATGARRIPALGPVVSRGAKVLFAVKLDGGNFEARVQAIDSGLEGGAWSEPCLFTVP